MTTDPLDGLLGLLEARQNTPDDLLADIRGIYTMDRRTQRFIVSAANWTSTQAPALIAEARRLREAVRDLADVNKFKKLETVSTKLMDSCEKHAATIAAVQEKT